MFLVDFLMGSEYGLFKGIYPLVICDITIEHGHGNR